MRTVRRNRGFTLIELLIALVVFGVLTVVAYQGLNDLLHIRSQSEVEVERMAELQKAWTMIARDIEMMINRPVRDEYGDRQEALKSAGSSGGHNLEFTRNGWANPRGLPRSHLQRVAYEVREGDLWRLYWPVLDRAQDAGEQRQATVLLHGVKGMEVRFFERANGRWVTEWPVFNPQTGARSEGLPDAVAINLEIAEFGSVSRIMQTVGRGM